MRLNLEQPMFFLLSLLACDAMVTESDCERSCDLYWNACMKGEAPNGEPDATRSAELAEECAAACPDAYEADRRATEEWAECHKDIEAEIIEYEADGESCHALWDACDPGELFNPLPD